MREMWELPGPSAGTRALRAARDLGLAWAVVAVPLTLWLALRTPPEPPAPAHRSLSVMENAAAHGGTQELSHELVSLSSTVVSATARLEVSETADVARGFSHGSVRSGTQSAELLVFGGRVLLRGGAAFWSTVGVPTSEPGWIEVGDRLGTIPFPVAQASAALEPGPGAVVDFTSPGAAAMTFRNGALVAEFTNTCLAMLTLGDRTAKVARPSVDELAALTSAPFDRIGDTAKLVGTSGALTVSPIPPPGS